MKFFFLAVFTLFFSNSLASADPVILRLGTAAPEKTPWGTAISRFVEDVSNLSDGAIEVQPAFNSELGDEPTMARQLPRGRLDIAFLSNAASSLLVPEFGLLMAPYLFDNMNQADCVFDHHIVDTFNTPFKAAGVEMLTSVEIGRMVFMATKPLHRPADLRGQKIRTAPTLTDTTYIQAMGATPVPLGNVESMVAIRTGLVVAVTTPIVMGVAAGFAAEGPEITVTQHGHQVGALLISRKSWDRLDANGQTALREAAQVMTELRPAVRAAETQLLAGAALEGATVHELTDEEMAEWESYAIEATELVVDDLGPAGARTWHRLQCGKGDLCRMSGMDERLLTFLERTEGVVAAISYGLVAALLIGEVIARELFGATVLGAGQIAVLATIVAAFLGLSLATAADRHLRTEALSRLLPARFDRAVGRVSDTVSAGIYFILASFAIQFVSETLIAGDRAAVLLFPLWPIQLVLPYAFLSCGIRHGLQAILPEIKPGAPQSNTGI